MKNVNNPLLFLVEENQVYRDFLASYLAERKFTNIRILGSAAELMNQLNLKPDVIVIDHSMTGIPGLELMKKVKKQLPRVDFIFLSAHDNVEVAVHHIKSGAFDFIIKNEHAPEKLFRSLSSDLKSSRKMDKNRAIRRGIFAFFCILIVFIITVVAFRYFFDW